MSMQLVQSKKLELVRQAKVLQKKLDLLDKLPAMSQMELELEVFDLWDLHSSGVLSHGDLLAGLARSGALVEGLREGDVSIEDALQAGGGVVGGMDRAAFGRFLEHLVERAGGDMHGWVSLLVLEWQPPLPEAALGRDDAALESAVSVASSDGRMRNLFALFDLQLSGKISFREVAVGLRKIAPHVSLSRAAQAAVEVLLWYDKDSDRSLSYHEFCHFVCAFCHAGGLEFGQVADALVLAAARPDPPPEEELWLDEELADLRGNRHFADARMQRIFDLLDADNDSLLSFKQLSLLLHRFEPCGLNQLFAMRYGTIPVAHATGGLRDTIDDYNAFATDATQAGTGWTFGPPEMQPFVRAVDTALSVYRGQPDKWLDLQLNGMCRDLSWARAAMQYEEVFSWAKIDNAVAPN